MPDGAESSKERPFPKSPSGKTTGFAETRLAPRGPVRHHRRRPQDKNDERVWMAKGKAKKLRCEDCFFHQNMLCALEQGEPCTTFRPADRGLAPERQLAFSFRTGTPRAAYAFPAPQ